LIVVASIHQPSSSVFRLFDKLLLLSGGKSHYFGAVNQVGTYFESLGYPIPIHTNPAEYLLEFMNVDFGNANSRAHERLDQMQISWVESALSRNLSTQLHTTWRTVDSLPEPTASKGSFFILLMTLIHRSFIKSYRDVVVCVFLPFQH
jgi:ABC-type multidrug transport system ATPase subunit